MCPFKCSAGKRCQSNLDCAPQDPVKYGRCEDPANSDGKCNEIDSCICGSCSDGIMQSDETDVDCGGVCGATCEVGQQCSKNGDCAQSEDETEPLRTCSPDDKICVKPFAFDIVLTGDLAPSQVVGYLKFSVRDDSGTVGFACDPNELRQCKPKDDPNFLGTISCEGGDELVVSFSSLTGFPPKGAEREGGYGLMDGGRCDGLTGNPINVGELTLDDFDVRDTFGRPIEFFDKRIKIDPR